MLEMNGGRADDSERDGDPARPAVQGPEFAFPGPPDPPPWSRPPEPPPAYGQPAGMGAAVSQPAAVDGVWGSQPAAVDGVWGSQPAATGGQANGQGRPRGLRRWPRASLAALIVVGLCAVGAGGAALTQELTRHATKAEAQAAAQAEVDSRWERLPAGQIFPSELGYTDSAGSIERIHRVGIAPRATCVQATDPVIAQALAAAGCVTVLRATYVDASTAIVTTLGIAVMPSVAAAASAYDTVDIDTNAGVRAVGFPGTAANLFGNAQRQAFALQYQGPYIFFESIGYSDGRPRTAGPHEAVVTNLGDGILVDLTAVMTGYGNACQEKDIRC